MPHSKPQWMLDRLSALESAPRETSTPWSRFARRDRLPVVELVDATPPAWEGDSRADSFQTQMTVVKPVNPSDPWSFLEPFDQTYRTDGIWPPEIPATGDLDPLV
ncbi:hypothetical protein EJ065_3295 [Corallococcus coralloides]|uniref:Uncharacterized protein n=1 Tax=Corallococcus coralloides TaxID=184914 RepID=A0A410RSJ0_CORCK|nr:hypothetical protein EJ065_3295 [Corallococcus coralloides]